MLRRQKASISVPLPVVIEEKEEILSQEILTQKSPEPVPEPKPRLTVKRKLTIHEEDKKPIIVETQAQDEASQTDEDDEEINLGKEEGQICEDSEDEEERCQIPEKPRRTNVPICHVHELNCQIGKLLTVLNMTKRKLPKDSHEEFNSLIKVWQSEQDRWNKVEKNHKVASERKKRKVEKESVDTTKITSEVKCPLKHNHCRVK